jgi:hypothetical protein
MNKTATLLILFIGSCMLFTSCYYDNEEMLYPQAAGACDTSNVTFGGTIAPILNDNCLSCHSDANASFGGGVHLQSLNDIRSNSPRIMPAVTRTGPKPMPPNGVLKPCSVTQLGIWIRIGMPGN